MLSAICNFLFPPADAEMGTAGGSGESSTEIHNRAPQVTTYNPSKLFTPDVFVAISAHETLTYLPPSRSSCLLLLPHTLTPLILPAVAPVVLKARPCMHTRESSSASILVFPLCFP